MNKKKLLQVSIAAAIAVVLLIPGNVFVIGQVLQDTIAPSVTITQPTANANLNTANVAVTGTATDNVGVVSVEVFLDNISKGNATLTPSNGTSVSWSMTLTLLAQGAHNIIATAKDNASNTQSASVNFVVDTAPPSILAPSPITVQANTAGGASNAHPSITTFLSGALTLDAIDPNPTVTNNAPALFPLGTTTVTFTSIDDAGNSASDSSTVTVVDTTLPSITITQPTNGTKFNTTGITVKGTVSDATVTSVEILVDNLSQGNAALNNTVWTKALTLAQGSHTITAKAKDGANNTASASISVIIDTTAPIVSITSPANNATLTATSVKINGTASDANGIASVVVSIDGGSASTASFNATTGKWTLQTTLTDGTHTIKATATDMAGNKAMASISVKILSAVVDTVAPSIEITSLGVTAIVDGTNASKFNVTIAGTASDNNGLALVQVKIDNSAFANTIGTTAWSFKTVLSSGTHTITAKATDNAGNVNSKMISLTLQTIVGNQPSPNNPPPATPPAAGQNTYSCNGNQINGDLELEDANATFIDCEIRGNMSMEDSKAAFKKSVVRGGMKVEDSDVILDSSELRGTLHMEGGSLVLKDNMIRGNVKLCETELTQIGNNVVTGQIKNCEDEGDDDEDEEEEEKHESSNSGHSNAGNSNDSHEKGNSGSNGNSGKDKDDDEGNSEKDKNHSGKGKSKSKGKNKDDD